MVAPIGLPPGWPHPPGLSAPSALLTGASAFHAASAFFSTSVVSRSSSIDSGAAGSTALSNGSAPVAALQARCPTLTLIFQWGCWQVPSASRRRVDELLPDAPRACCQGLGSGHMLGSRPASASLGRCLPLPGAAKPSASEHSAGCCCGCWARWRAACGAWAAMLLACRSRSVRQHAPAPLPCSIPCSPPVSGRPLELRPCAPATALLGPGPEEGPQNPPVQGWGVRGKSHASGTVNALALLQAWGSRGSSAAPPAKQGLGLGWPGCGGAAAGKLRPRVATWPCSAASRPWQTRTCLCASSLRRQLHSLTLIGGGILSRMCM